MQVSCNLPVVLSRQATPSGWIGRSVEGRLNLQQGHPYLSGSCWPPTVWYRLCFLPESTRRRRWRPSRYTNTPARTTTKIKPKKSVLAEGREAGMVTDSVDVAFVSVWFSSAEAPSIDLISGVPVIRESGPCWKENRYIFWNIGFPRIKLIKAQRGEVPLSSWWYPHRV